MSPRRGDERLRLAVFSPNAVTPTETFIRAHVERLPFDTQHLHGMQWQRFRCTGALGRMLRLPGVALSRLSPGLGRVLHDGLLSWELRRAGIQVALAEYGTTGAEIQDACRRAGVPFVVYFYGFDATSRPVLETLLPEYRRMFSQATAIVSVSPSITARLLEWGAPAERLHEVVCGADADRFSEMDPGAAPPHFVAVGRFVEKKAPYLTVLAFRDVAVEVPSARLTMVGDGPLLGPSRRLAAALGIADRVAFPGVQSPGEVARLFAGARAFVQHSLPAEDGDSEGTPVAILEAQMSGLPVVSTRHAGIPAVVADGKTALLVDEGDARAMGDAMKRLAKDAALAREMGRAARARALSSYTLDSHLDRLAGILRDAASEKAR